MYTTVLGGSTMKVAVATKSSDKITGIKETILRFFNLKENEVDFFSKSVNSGVSEQPFDSDTYQGALNRATGIQEEIHGMDFYISCEAGIENAFGQYFNVQVVCILMSNGKTLWGKSSGWTIPTEDIEIIRKNNLDKYLRDKGITCLEDLLGPSYSRSAAVADATCMALASGKLMNL